MTDTLDAVEIPDVDAAESRAAAIGGFTLEWGDHRPASLRVSGSVLVGRRAVALVEVFTAAEQRARTSQAYYRSAVGERLRVGAVERDGDGLTVTQLDPVTGLEATTRLTTPTADSIRIETRVANTAAQTVVLTAVGSATIGIARSEVDLDRIVVSTARSEWLAENRWFDAPLRDSVPDLSLPIHGQDGRGHGSWTSHGAWSTGELLPVGALADTTTGEAIAWQIESSAGWHVDISQGADGAVLTLLGPTDLEHQFAQALGPGEGFDAVPVALTVSAVGRDGALAALTPYRRTLRPDAAAEGVPIVYNDFMNTLMGQPSTEKLLPLIGAAAEAGAEVFCIDAGWFADPEIGDWWSTVGEWREASTRFDAAGLRGVVDEIHRHGLRSGLWLEPEVVGVRSPAAATLPDEAFFTRFGVRVQEHERFHLDFRHPAARAHLDATVDHLVAEYGISYLKLDYNINPGAGTEADAAGAGAGLLGHVRAYRDWLVAVQERHPGLLLENCSSGAMRADYGLLAVTHLQSTTDQQDFLRYPPVAASAPASILPEQCGNWAYPAADMTDAETAFTLVTGLSGRLYLSGFLGRLRPSQWALVTEATALHKDLRAGLAESTPFWPLGLPGWDDEVICLGLHTSDADLIFVWDRGAEPGEVLIPGVFGEASFLFPAAPADWSAVSTRYGLLLRTAPGTAARVLRVDTQPGGRAHDYRNEKGDLMKAVMVMASDARDLVFTEDDLAKLRDMLDVDTDRMITSLDALSEEERARTELLVTGWGTPDLGPADLDTLPSLRAVVHWGGGVGFLDSSANDRGIVVSSARAVNAIPVAQFTVAMIVLAAKEAFWVSRRYGAEQRFIDREAELSHTGLYRSTIGIVGASSIGSLTIEMLADYDVDVLVYDPYLTPDRAAALGVEIVGDLVELARRSRILSIHTPDIPALRGMISRDVLAALPDGATVINTARGRLVDQDGLVDELQSGRLRAILDVTYPDVLPAGHPLYTLPNVFLTPHLAGSTGSELRRLGATATDEVERLVTGQEFQHPITP
ncbi:NAD(P)-dependent oxidoreductase [Microbacterium sp. NPDC056569]|uniref:NAD(P)-dependent oxidoreductase n=1 Tax=Microbacterium sp. NPDC056569 TaxID=3345867 RepID=UPI00366C33DC